MRLKYGISLRNGPENWTKVVGQIDNSVFPALELGGGVFDRPAERIAEQLRGWEFVGLADIMPSSLTRSVAEQTKRLADDFREQFSMLCERSAAVGASSLLMDFAVESTRGRLPARLALLDMLKGLAPALHRNSLRLCFPVRVPFSHTWLSEHLNDFFVDVMSPRFRCSLDIAPHELVSGFREGDRDVARNIRDLTRWLRFDIGQVRFMYDPGMGGALDQSMLAPWVEKLAGDCFDGPVMFCPKIGAEGFHAEVDKLSKLVAGLGI